LNTESVVVERGISSKNQEANLQSTDVDGEYDGIVQKNVHRNMLFAYDKHRTKDSHENKPYRSEKLNPENS
jgi:hypothetical protein